MAERELGSLTKEPPLATLDDTIRAIAPGVSYSALLMHARVHTHRDAPGLIRQRFLLVRKDGTISYDHFLSLAAIHRLESPLIRKIMYFVWAYRDERIRRFICERVADDSGRWRVAQLLDKRNAKFFEQWLAPSTAKKARSNFEYFLVETKIFDPKSKAIHLELDDGWLHDAAIVAAQHEPRALAREELLANPIDFLRKSGWIGLVNPPGAVLPVISPLLSTDSLPFEDQQIPTSPSDVTSGTDWQRRNVASAKKRSATAEIDLVARERANRTHYLLEVH
jgi:hypothetical protein